MYLIGPTDGHVMTVTWIQRMSTVETQWTSRCWKTFRTNKQKQTYKINQNMNLSFTHL